MSEKHIKASAKERGPFGAAALDLHCRNLVVLPCNGDDGKTPAAKSWHKRRSKTTIDNWAARMSSLNIGVAVGASGLVVVDVDTPGDEALRRALEIFGDTPLITRTPRGGAHLWYRKTGKVKSGPFEIDGIKGDIKADGGYVLVPPSISPALGRGYHFVKGSWDDLPHLPIFKGEPPREQPKGPRQISPGDRNEALFRFAREQAKTAAGLEDLVQRAHAYNEVYLCPPLPDAEVNKTCESAWRYQSQGRNYCRGDQYIHLMDAEIEAMRVDPNGPDAMMLLSILRKSHAVRVEPFAIATQAMRDAQVIPGWSEKRYRKARDTLLALGLIYRIVEASHGRGGAFTPALYRLCPPSSHIADNITNTPPPAPGPD